MALPLQVPPAFLGPLRALERLPEADFKRLVSELEQVAPFAPRPRTRVREAFSRAMPDIDPDAFRRALTSLPLQFPDESRDSLAESVAHSADIELTRQRRRKLVTRLSVLLGIEALRAVSKADDVLTDHEHVFLDARVLTDVRSVFGDDPSEPPPAAVIVQMLRVDHSTDGGRKSFYVALDERDLQKLKSVAERALIKAETVKKFLGTAGLSIYEKEELSDGST